MRENFGHGWVDRGPRRMTDYDDIPNKVGRHWNYADDEPADSEDDVV